MEQVATVEQAEPQNGSAAPTSPASTPSFGEQYKAHVFKTQAPAPPTTQPAVSSGDAGTSATDEQPASDASHAGTPDTDGTDTETPTDGQPPKLSRSQRKAMRTQTPAEQAASSTTDTSTSVPDADPIARVERVVTERLDKLESALRPPTPASPDEQAYATVYAQTFGADQEFARRAQLAISSPTDLSYDEQTELERWAGNRKAGDLNDLKWKRNLSAAALSSADKSGLDPQTLTSAVSPDQIFSAFLEHGRSLERTAADAKVAEITARAEKAEAASRLMADELEALQGHIPAGARRFIAGGVSAIPGNGPTIDRQKADGRTLLAAGIAQRDRARNGTRRGAAGITSGGNR